MIWPRGLRISRMSGAENTFFVINAFDSSWAPLFLQMTDSDKRNLAKHLCRDFYGFHTDGILFVRPEKGFDFAWDFFNSDGSKAEMCGNAARCATLFFHSKVQNKQPARFLTGAGEISGEVLPNGQVRIQMTEISDSKMMSVLGKKGYFVNTGVPHFVINQSPDTEIAVALRKVSDFGPPGSNITFVEQLQDDSIQAVTYERGVEDYTRACGTGAVAAAMYLQSVKGPRETVKVQMPGGLLIIHGAQSGKRPFLTGPTQFDFDLENWENHK
jgi:diaminopimelate epimerase